MELFMTAQKRMGGQTYVGVSLLVPSVSGFHDGLNHALEDLKLPAPADDPVDIMERKLMIPCVEAVVEEFDNRSGDGESVLEYREKKEDICRNSGSSRY